MNKKSLSLLLVFALLLLSTMVLSITNLKIAYAQASSSSIDVKVDHQVTIHDGGLVTINDTVRLSAKQAEQSATISSLSVGFPFKYKLNLDYVFAYESSNFENKLALDLDYGLGNIGFYAVRVNFGREINLTKVESYIFTVVFVFSNLITASPLEDNIPFFDFDYPVYPSLVQEASVSNTTVLLPQNANYTSSDPTLNQTTSHTLNIVKKPLDAFSSVTGTITFKPSGSFNLIEVNEVKRNIVIDEWNELSVSDFYTTTNKAANETSTLWALLPQNAYDVYAKDDLGNKLGLSQQNVTGAIKAILALAFPIKQNENTHVFVMFKLPWKDHVEQNGWNNFHLKFRLFEPGNLTLRKLTVTINLPEGAKLQSPNMSTLPNTVESGAFQENPVFTLNNVTSFLNLDFTITYTHMVFWAAFRPTMWTGALVLIIGAVALVWQTQRAPAPVPTGLPIHPEELRNYVRTYEEERKILQERESLEVQARKGKIPRRLYRVRSRTLESRLSVLSRELATLREKIRTAGPRYAEMMRQIEVAQTELQGVEADIRRTEARYRRGEISAAAYHKLLEDSFRRRDRAKTNIDGVLLRLREEMS